MESKLYNQEQEALRQKEEMEARFEKQQKQINDLVATISSNSTDPNIEITTDEETGRRYSYNHSSGETTWVDEE